ncbi:ubiquitin-conjugating enzyme E2 Q, partial [Lecanoromycetidae sp. Uapishka_2]
MYNARFDQPKMELVFASGSEKVLHPGNWITFSVQEQRFHCRVVEVMHPTVKLGPPVVRDAAKSGKPKQPTAVSVSQRHLSGTNSANIPSTITPAATPPPATELLPTKLQEISFAIYDHNFDDLDASEKASSICMMLDNLPSVQQMGDFLRSKGSQDTSLRSWADRISPAALGIIRWIIASNRSCIVQVDSIDGSSRKSEERVSGMPGWMQFRFAQGAPDKEQRFVTSIKETTAQQQYPTMFAWHGSPLHNWHGIVREGLHFKKADHGRAFGDGCYHSLDAITSLGYSAAYAGRGHVAYNSDFEEGPIFGQWPHSQLRISQAIALNEIVNAPSQFQSNSPHLVVAQLDWIQSRYLFVKCHIQGMQIPDRGPTQVYDQDPQYTPRGDQHCKIIIPITAVSKSRRLLSKEIKNGHKKVKVDNVQEAEEAALLSDETDIEDVSIFFSDTEEAEVIGTTHASKGKGKISSDTPTKPDALKTDFQPGTLDHKNLPLLEPPSYATSMATRALQKELTATLKVQDTHPSHELGWYIDRELINNVYQWIIELHSFESHLPLAKDMKSKDLKSVVMEIRFGKNYPMSPPFVRVIRPRFMSFMQGGGGHVTAGGALCMELLTNSGWSAWEIPQDFKATYAGPSQRMGF